MDTRGKRALDVASGEGFFLDLCVPEIFSLEDVMATEFSDDSASVLRSKGYRASSADLRSPEFDAMHEMFDFIFLFQVVEHMDEIDELFARLSQLTKPAGSIFIAVPNSKWVAYREETGSLMDLPPTHIGRWTPQAFGAVASRHGLALTTHEVEPFSAPSFILDDIIFSHFARSMRVGTVANKARSLRSRAFRLLGEAAEAVTFAPSRARALSRAIRQREQMGGPALWVQLRNTKSEGRESGAEHLRITPGERRRLPSDARRDLKLRVGPAPVAIQRRARAARHARASATALRVGVLILADLLVLSFDYTAVDFLRSPASPSRSSASSSWSSFRAERFRASKSCLQSFSG
jgi:SAM-dependent methyltransferase